MQKTCVLLEQHDRVVEQLLFSGLVHEVVVCLENRVILNAVAEVFNHSWLHFLVADEDGEADIVEFPPPVDGEIVVDLVPHA